MRRTGVRTAVLVGCAALWVTAGASAPSGAASADLLPDAAGGIQTYYGDQAGFDAATGAPVAVTFDDITPGTDIDGTAIGDVTFSAGSAATAAPIVVDAADTVTPGGFTGDGIPFDPADNTLVATSGANVLSPGGPTLGPGLDPAVEDDDLLVRFSRPMSAVGFDLLFQSLDGWSGVALRLLDPSGNELYGTELVPSGSDDAGAPGGAWFVGFVSPTANIASLVIDEYDDNAVLPDANIGFDTFRFSARPPVVVAGTAAVVEGDTGMVTMEIPVALSWPTDVAVTAGWTTVFDPSWSTVAAQPGVDYDSASGTVTFAPGETEQTVALTVHGDSFVEQDELVVVALANPTNATIGGLWGLGLGEITNDDIPPVVLPGGASVDEGDTGTTVVGVPVSLSAPSPVTVTVAWTTIFDPTWSPDLAAAPGTDYQEASGTVTFAPGITEQTVAVTVNGDVDMESHELLVVSFRAPTNATIGGFYGLGLGGITNDD